MSKPFLFYLFMKKGMYGSNAKLNSIKLNLILFFKVPEWFFSNTFKKIKNVACLKYYCVT